MTVYVNGIGCTSDKKYGEMYTISGGEIEVVTQNVWEAVILNVSQGELNGFTYDAGGSGGIDSVADAGLGDITVTTPDAHGLSIGDYITITGSTDYDGIYEIKTVPSGTTYTVTKAFTETRTGSWIQGASLTATKTATYRGMWSACGTAANNGDVLHFSPCKNTTVASKAIGKRKFSNVDVGSFSGCAIMSVTVGDVIFFCVKNTSGTGNITISDRDMNLVEI